MFASNKYTNWYNTLITRAKARNTTIGYIEKHHIIPRSLGGLDVSDNLVSLTAREHYIAHLLLTKMTRGKDYHRMVMALVMMQYGSRKHIRDYTITARRVALLREQSALAKSALTKGKSKHTLESKQKLREKATGRPSPNKGKPMPEEQRRKIAETLSGRAPSPETVRKIHKKRQGYRHSSETKQKIAEGNRGKTVKISDETRKKISESLSGIPRPWVKGRPEGYKHTEESLDKMRKSHSNRPMIECGKCGAVVPKPNHARWHGAKCIR